MNDHETLAEKNISDLRIQLAAEVQRREAAEREVAKLTTRVSVDLETMGEDDAQIGRLQDTVASLSRRLEALQAAVTVAINTIWLEAAKKALMDALDASREEKP